MSTTTTRLGLHKPATTGENVNVATDINGNMDDIDAAMGFRPVTSGTMPGAPAYDGEAVHQTDTDRFYVGTGGAWLQVVTEDVAFLDHLRISRAASSDAALFAKANADTQDRWAMAASGLMEWGPGGVTARDVNLYRDAANVLKTDDSFVIGGEPTVTTPRFLELTRNATQSILNNTVTDIQWTVESSDVRGMFAAPAATFSVPAGAGGLWGIRAFARFAANVTGTRLMQLLLNGTAIIEDRDSANTVGGQPHSMHFAIDKLLVAGDQLKIAVFQNSGGALNIESTQPPVVTYSRYQ